MSKDTANLQKNNINKILLLSLLLLLLLLPPPLLVMMVLIVVWRDKTHIYIYI